MDIDSEHKICRLCYNKSIYSTTVADSDLYIDIYSTAGIVQNCAQLITDFLHLDVSQNDEYSKSVCLLCWNRLMVFNEFYTYVNEIQKEYLGEKYHVVKEEYPYPPTSRVSITTLNNLSAISMPPTLQFPERCLPTDVVNHIQMENYGSIKHEDQPPSSQSLISLPFPLPIKSPTPLPGPNLEESERPNNSNVINGNKLKKLNDDDKTGQTTMGKITGGKRELELVKFVPAKKLKRKTQKNDTDRAKLKSPPAVVEPQDIELSAPASDSGPLVWIISKILGTASVIQDKDVPNKILEPKLLDRIFELSDSDDDNTPLAWLVSKNSGTTNVMKPHRALSKKMFPTHKLLEPELPDRNIELVGANLDKNDSIANHQSSGISNNSRKNKKLPAVLCDAVPAVVAKPQNMDSIEPNDSGNVNDGNGHANTLVANPESDDSDTDSVTKFPTRDFRFKNFGIKISKRVQFFARDAQNEDLPGQEVLDIFPKSIVENGKLVVSKKTLFLIISQFYKLECDMCPPGERRRFAFINDLYNHHRSKHNSLGYVRCCNMKLFECDQIQIHLLRHIQPEALIKLSDTDSISDKTTPAWISGAVSAIPDRYLPKKKFPAHTILEPQPPDKIVELVSDNLDTNDSIANHQGKGISNNAQTNKELPDELCDAVPPVMAEPVVIDSIELSDSDHDVDYDYTPIANNELEIVEMVSDNLDTNDSIANHQGNGISNNAQTNKELPDELCDAVPPVMAEPQIIDSIELSDSDHDVDYDCTPIANPESEESDTDTYDVTKFPARDFRFEDFGIQRISETVKSSARDPRNENLPAQTVLNTFPKTIVENGKLVISTKTLFFIISKFYKLECDMCPPGDRPQFAFINGLYNHQRFIHHSLGYVRCCNMQLFDYAQIQMHLVRHIQPQALHCDDVLPSPKNCGPDGLPLVRRTIDISFACRTVKHLQNSTNDVRRLDCKCSILGCNSTRRMYDRLFKITPDHLLYDRLRLFMDPSVFQGKLMFICSKHFEERCFVNRNLRKKAMPSLNLPIVKIFPV